MENLLTSCSLAKSSILFIFNGAKYKPISNMLLPTQETRERKREIAKMNCFEEWKLVIAMVVVDFALAIVNILFKNVLNGGMNHLLIVTYRQAISAIFLTPIAYFLERYASNLSISTSFHFWRNQEVTGINFPHPHSCRKSRPRITARILCDLFISALVGFVTLFNFYCCAIINRANNWALKMS